MKKITLLSLTLLGLLCAAQKKTTGDMTLSPNIGIVANFTLDNATSKVTLILKGPADRWFGLGIGVSAGFSMEEGDAVVYSANTTPKLTDRNFVGTQQPPLDSSQDWTIVSDIVAGTLRTVTLTRSLTNSDANDYQMPYATTNSISVAGPRPATATQTVAPHGGTANVGYATASFTEVLGVNDVSNLSKVSIYPNPVKDILNFTNADKIKSVRIFDATGKQFPAQKSVSNMNVSTLGKGVYFVEVEKLDGTMAYEKFIKN